MNGSGHFLAPYSWLDILLLDSDRDLKKGADAISSKSGTGNFLDKLSMTVANEGSVYRPVLLV